MPSRFAACPVESTRSPAIQASSDQGQVGRCLGWHGLPLHPLLQRHLGVLTPSRRPLLGACRLRLWSLNLGWRHTEAEAGAKRLSAGWVAASFWLHGAAAPSHRFKSWTAKKTRARVVWPSVGGCGEAVVVPPLQRTSPMPRRKRPPPLRPPPPPAPRRCRRCPPARWPRGTTPRSGPGPPGCASTCRRPRRRVAGGCP